MADQQWNPYWCNNTITVTSHNPPELSSSPPDAFTEQALQEIRTKSPLYRAVHRQRVEGPAVSNPRQLALKIRKQIAVGDKKAAQVVVVTSPEINNNKPVVAKFYDCAFADYEDWDVDETRSVDRQYINETAAYAKLRDCWGIVVPRYFGSYTVDFMTPLGRHTVRLILVQYITGPALLQYERWTCDDIGAWSCQVSLNQHERKNLLQKLVLADAYVRERGVYHEDVTFRNVILHSGRPGDENARVMLIDFGDSVCFIPQEGEELRNGRLASPAEEWDTGLGRYHEIAHWVDWDWNVWIRNWLKDYQRFAPPEY